jgi:hypothetical protein
MSHTDLCAGLTLLPPHVCLIQHLTDKLLSLPKDQLRSYTIVLPTHRLCTFLTAELAKRVTAFFPPRMTTFENLLHDLMPAAENVASDMMVDMILRSIIDSGDFKHVLNGHERELRLFITETVESGIADPFEFLKQAATSDVHHADPHTNSLLQRFEEMSMIIGRMRKQLDSLGYKFAPEAGIQRINQIAGLPPNSDKSAVKMIFAGFTSMLPTWDPLLKVLCVRPGVEFVLSEPPAMFGEVNPLEELISRLAKFGAKIGHAANASGAKGPENCLAVMKCPSRLHEVKEALRHYETLTQDGIPGAQIALLVTSESTYGPIIRSLVSSMNIDANIALTLPLGETAMGLWISALINFLSARQNSSSLLALLLHPITGSCFKKEPALSAIDAETLRAAFIRTCAAMSTAPELEQIIATEKDAAVCDALRVLMTYTTPGAFNLHEKNPLSCWMNFFDKWITAFAPDQHIADNDIQKSATQAYQTFKESMEQISEKLDIKLSLADFIEIIKEKLLAADIRQVGEPLAGLQIISLPQARYIPFTYAIILGCNEGVFPAALPRDDLIDDFLKRKIGLPGWRALEAREDLTYTLLKARLPHLVLFHAESEVDDPLVRSRFIEKLHCETNPISLSHPVHQSMTHTASGEEAPDLNATGCYPLDRKELLQEFSANTLTKLIACPYQFLLHKLEVKELSLTSTLVEVQNEGMLLHAILEAFFTSCYEGRTIIDPWPEHLSGADFGAMALARLNDLTKKLGPTGFENTPLFYHLVSHSWPCFVQHLNTVFGPGQFHRIKDGKKELDLKGWYDLPYEENDRKHNLKRRLIGRIDSLDSLSGYHIITDYKRKTVPSQKNLTLGAKPQLAFYALAIEAQDDGLRREQSIIGYFNILEGTWEVRGAGALAKANAAAAPLIKKKTPDNEENIANMLHLWQWREAAIGSEERFFADTSDCGLCPYPAVCRKNQPMWREYYEKNRSLAAKLST